MNSKLIEIIINNDPDNFYKAKIASGNYFMTKILPETGSLMSSILFGAKFFNDYDDNFFDSVILLKNI